MHAYHVVYHGNCYDGWGAAWVAKQAMPDAVLLPGVYGKPIPDVPDGATVYMIDISYPREQMEALRQRVKLRVLDHHKTAQANLEGFPNCVFDMNRSGAMLAWNEFFPGQPPPKLIEYVQDQDLWTWNMPNSSEVCAYIRSYPRDFDSWNYLNELLSVEKAGLDNYGLLKAANTGRAIMRSDAQRVEEMCEQVQWRTIGGYTVPVVNASVQFSAVGNTLCKKYPDAAFAGYYFDRGDGVRQWGLRSIGEFDVSAIAKQYGGGGHKNASGYQEDL